MNIVMRPDCDSLKKCPHCAEDIKQQAIQCRYCGMSLVLLPGQHQSSPHLKVVNKSLLEQERALSEKDLLIFNSELQSRRKSVLAAYLLWFFLGGIGAHKFYLGNVALGVVYLCASIIGWLTVWILIGFALILPLGGALLYDLFTLPSQVNDSNEQIKCELISKLSTT